MFNKHMEFIQWAGKYDTRDTFMRSKQLHDEWLKSILCKKIVIDGTISTDIVLSKMEQLFAK